MALTAQTSGASGEIPAGDIPVAVEPAVGKPTKDDIATLAYQFWYERGNQKGSADANWFEAERQLRAIGPRT